MTCSGAAASEALQQRSALSKEQAEGVLNMSLRRLTSLEANRLQEESQQLHARYPISRPTWQSAFYQANHDEQDAKLNDKPKPGWLSALQ